MVRASSNPQHIFSIAYPMQLFNLFGLGGPAVNNRKQVTLWQSPRSCLAKDADSVDEICTDFTGI